MQILAIETSCDETSASVVKNGIEVLSNVISSSKDAFTDSGGVIPEKAAREQVRCTLPVIHQALDKADVTENQIDAIAVTKGPGLLVSLLVGSTVARTLASIWDKPLIGVHHTLGHLSSTFLEQTDDIKFPILALSASGGHTDLWLRESHTEGKLLGRTRDDAAGEAFDKGAQLLGLPYPGGPSIAKSALEGNYDAFEFPLPLHDDESLDFSFSGLKTSLKYLINDTPDFASRIPDISASYQHAICKHLIDRMVKTLEVYTQVKEVHLVGGVSANIHLRTLTEEAIKPKKLRVPIKISYCTDNAAMIGAAAYYLFKEAGKKAYEEFETVSSLPLEAAVK